MIYLKKYGFLYKRVSYPSASNHAWNQFARLAMECKDGCNYLQRVVADRRDQI